MTENNEIHIGHVKGFKNHDGDFIQWASLGIVSISDAKAMIKNIQDVIKKLEA